MQATDLIQTPVAADENRLFERVIWVLVSLCVILSGGMIGALVMGYLRFSAPLN